MDGWIKVHRKILENPFVCKDADYLSVWLYILLNATHKDYPVLFKGDRINLVPGQLLTSRKSISEKLKINESKVTRILNAFENEQQIEQQASNKNRLITVLNWNTYQICEHQENNERTTVEQQLNNERTTSEQQVNTNKNVKNVKNDKEDIIYCSEPKEDLASEPPVITLTLNDKSEYPIYQKDIDEWKELYPAVDVMQQLRSMKGWCNGNPTKRKTKKGIKRFINSWLAKEQDKGGNKTSINGKCQSSQDILAKFMNGGN